MSQAGESTSVRYADGGLPVGWWKASSSSVGRIDCQLCPRHCSLKAGDRGFCFVRENRDGQMVLSTYGKSTGFCIDPIEKKPLNHFYPGTSVLSFGTAGCNLGCKFCQNWDISKSREVARLSARAEPDTIVRAALANNCTSVAFTYNDPVVWAEYAIDTAKACRAVGIKTVAVTAGYITAMARQPFFSEMDAVNVDLKAFTEEFYRSVTYSHLQPVLETIAFLKHETDVWFELTNLIIPGANDNPDELRKMCNWILQTVGDQIPIHFSAFHPDFRMTDRGATDPQTLVMAYDIARSEGLRYVYVGNLRDVKRQSTFCHQCGHLLIEREGYRLGSYTIHSDTADGSGRCPMCKTSIPGRFAARAGDWGERRQPLRIEQYADSLPATAFIALEEITVTSTNTNPATSTPQVKPVASQRPLKLGSLTADQRDLILKLGVAGVVQTVTRQPQKWPEEVLGSFAQTIVMGAFVTLKRGDTLRGCCGVIGKPIPLGAAINSAAQRTATEDQRFTPIAASELPYLSLDVTLLGPFKRIEAAGRQRAAEIQIGQHGVLIQHGDKNGLLLPSVATERGWDAERFLQAVCTKAGLPATAWESDAASLMVFEGQTLSTAMADQLPANVLAGGVLPLSPEQLAGYAQVAGENIVAMVTGGTPSYVITHLPDTTVSAIVLSLDWQADQSEEPPHQGSAVQVSFRPGVPLQSTLYQMCQQAAQRFYEQHFNGRLNIGLTIGFEPAMHGYGSRADLEGVDSSERALVISDSRHCGFAFDPHKSPAELLGLLRHNLPIGGRDAAVHSVRVLSTLPRVISVVAPPPVVTHGVRPPAVAGKFYPAEDAARRALVSRLLGEQQPKQYAALAAMVPHAGLKYSGAVASQAWRSIAQLDGRTLLIVSPKHTATGVNWSVSPFATWQLSRTVSFESDQELAQQLVERVDPLQLDASAHQQEHGIEVQLPLLERLAPNSKVVGLAIQGGSWEDIAAAAKQLAEFLQTLEQPPLLVISSDMNHYAADRENRRLDRLALDALGTGDPQHLIDVCRKHEISMCGLVPAALVMETLRQMGHTLKIIEVGYATSGEVSGDKSQVVGYAGALLLDQTQ